MLSKRMLFETYCYARDFEKFPKLNKGFDVRMRH